MTAHEIMTAPRKDVLPVAATLLLMFCGQALGDCNEDFANLGKKRQAVIDQLNQLAKGGKKQLDPVAACPKLRALAAAERDMVTYMTKNKDWCSIPDDAVQTFSTNAGKTAQMANQACKVAEQIKKAQEQPLSGGAGQPPMQKLPGGPL